MFGRTEEALLVCSEILLPAILIPVLGWRKAGEALEYLGKVARGREATVGCDLPDVTLGILHQLH